MFHKDDQIIEFLEQTMELHIPEEALRDKKETLKIIEENLEVKIPKKYQKKKKLEKYLQKANDDFLDFTKKQRPHRILKNTLFFILFLIPMMVLILNVTKNTSISYLHDLNKHMLSIFNILNIIRILIIITFLFSKYKEKSLKLRQSTVFMMGILIIYTIGIFSLIDLLYGNDKKYQDFIIRESMNTRNHQFVANLFYSTRTIENTLSKTNNLDSTDELYEFEKIDYETNTYANPYEKEILTREENQIYKIIKVEGTLRDGVSKYSGYMAVVYDPSKVKIAPSVGAGTSEDSFGQILSQISKNNNALVAMNAGGFYDPDWRSNGGIPHGTVIQNGEIKTNYNRGIESGGIIGFNKENKLILKRMSAEEAISMGIRDAVDWGPFLIVNGKNHFKEETSKWACARTVIGQRKDGIVLMLVIDGDQPHSKGASYSDLADIMERYGAYNAANLDGGTSTSMVEHHEYINIPFNGHQRTIRSLPNAWIVTKD